MNRSKNATILSVTACILLLCFSGLVLVSCDLFLSPARARSNPNDPSNPTPTVFDFKAFGSGPNRIDLKWQFDPEEEADADVIIIRNSLGEPTSVLDGTVVFEGRPDSGGESWFTAVDESVDTDSEYFYAIWSYSGPEDERVYNGPLADDATTQLQVAEVPPIADGEVYFDGAVAYTQFSDPYYRIQFDPGMNEYYILLMFDFEEAPDFGAINSASLRLYFSYSMLAAMTWDIHARRIVDPWSEGELPMDLYNKIAGGFFDPGSGSTTKINSDSYGFYYWSVKDIIESWLIEGEPEYGIIVHTTTADMDYFEFYSSETAEYSKRAILELSYYGDPAPDGPGMP